MDESYLVCLIFSSLLTLACCNSCAKEEFDTLKCDYIPEDIPKGIINVKIVNFLGKNELNEINSSFFQSENWRQIKILELQDESAKSNAAPIIFAMCFSGLKRLNTLKIHIRNNIYHLDNDTFLGLNTVKTLDLSGCTRISLKQIIPTFRGTNKLPQLEELLLSELGNNQNAQSAFDSSFSHSLKSKNITHLDVSRSRISLFNLKEITQDLNHLKVLNLSLSVVSVISHKGSKESDLMHIDIIDFCNTVFTTFWISQPFGKILISNYTIEDFDTRGHMKLLFAAKVVNVTDTIKVPNSVWIENCKANMNKPILWHTKEVIGRHNNIKRLDIKMRCSHYKIASFEHVDLSYNGMEFIHPSILACIPNILKLDLSGNQLFKMVDENLTLFQDLFQSLTKLYLVRLSINRLESIPTRLFQNNLELKEIDLSYNKLHQITFNLYHLKKLQILDLRGNQLQDLDDISIRTLSYFLTIVKRKHSRTMLLIEDNPFSCSTCRTKRSIQWLSTHLKVTSEHIICAKEDGTKAIITGDTVEMIQKICDRRTVVISTSTSAGVISLIIFVSVFAIYRKRKHARKMAKLENVLQNLNVGQGQFEFVTFLSYSSNDKDFVDTFVFNNLNENLKTMTGIERNLVCTGDEYLRPGFMILDETVRCIERVSVVIVVVSNSYCSSHYCHNELDVAYRLSKPIILMLKEHVDEEIMMPTMKMLFKNNVRILWAIECGEYVLKTTWKSVCASVLELIVHNS